MTDWAIHGLKPRGRQQTAITDATNTPTVDNIRLRLTFTESWIMLHSDSISQVEVMLKEADETQIFKYFIPNTHIEQVY